MARASASRGKGSRPNARAKQEQVAKKPERRQHSYEDQLFFSRLRRHMKWVFAALALVFAVGFVAFGVGAGGTGIGDALSDFFGSSSDIPSVEDAQKAVEENPNDPQAFRELANAYLAVGENDKAAEALRTYTTLQPEDTGTLRELATLLETEATAARARADLLRQQSSLGDFATNIYRLPGSSGFLALVGSNPVDQALSSKLGTDADKAQQEAADMYAEIVPVYDRLVELDPGDPTLLISLAGVADASGDTEKAIAAYQRYLELEPEGEYASLVTQQLQVLGVLVPETDTAPAGGTTGGATTDTTTTGG
jgi:tetratricopeptide (TPR) repeat protein